MLIQIPGRYTVPPYRGASKIWLNPSWVISVFPTDFGVDLTYSEGDVSKLLFIEGVSVEDIVSALNMGLA